MRGFGRLRAVAHEILPDMLPMCFCMSSLKLHGISREGGFGCENNFQDVYTSSFEICKGSQIHCHLDNYLYLIVLAFSLVKNNGERGLTNFHADLSEDSCTVYKFTWFNVLACI